MNTCDIFTVSNLTASIKNQLEGGFRGVYVQGEISNLKVHSSGHIYFSLKDQNAQISAALFRGNRAKLMRLPKDGDHVTLFGDISVYPPRGSYQILVKEVQFVGVGELLLRFHQLKEMLAKRGWFDSVHKKRLPLLPKRIGIVTSPTGAVIQDILNVLKRRFSGFHLILNPVKVQGDGSAEEITKAIQFFNQHNLADVLIVGRGGGSLEDLWAFNEEIVATAIFESRIPIISAVGHETDHTLADLVADIRAPTPSAAAEIAVREKTELLKFLDTAKERSSQYLLRKIRELSERLNMIAKQPCFSVPDTLLIRWMQELDERRNLLEIRMKHLLERKRLALTAFEKQHQGLNPIRQLAQMKQNLSGFQPRLDDSMIRSLRTKRERLQTLASHLKSIDPKNLLKKGYSILFSEKTGSVILSHKDVSVDDKISAMLSDGKVHSQVTHTKSEYE